MGKIRKCKLSWKPSDSDFLVGYKLYWSTENHVNYGSNSITLGNKTEVNLPDVLIGIVPSDENIIIGISAVDIMGNESDIITISEPYRISTPQAPLDLAMTTLDDYNIIASKKETEERTLDGQDPNAYQKAEKSLVDALRPPSKFVTTEGRIVDSFGGKIHKTS